MYDALTAAADQLAAHPDADKVAGLIAAMYEHAARLERAAKIAALDEDRPADAATSHRNQRAAEAKAAALRNR